MRILLIEDDEILIDRLLQSLTQRQYVVDAVLDGQEGLEYAQSTHYDLIIADVGLPSIDGISLCSRLRKDGTTTPILLMTAKDMPDERIRGLDAGADDHLTKPLNLEEMHARVRALIRRGEVVPETVLQAGPLQLDPVSCQVTYGSQFLKLTPKEYSLLELFMRSPNRVFSRSHIIEHLWNFDDPPLEDSVKAHIKGLRHKLKKVGAVNWIENVYGIGYRFTPEVETPSNSDIPINPPFDAGTQEIVSTPATLPSQSSLEQAFKDSMTVLWSKYQDLMTERIEALTQAAIALQNRSLTADLSTAAAVAAHKLAGVLGMFELDEGTDIARELETLLTSDSREGLERLPDLVQQLVDLVQRPPVQSATSTPTDTGYLLLVSADNALIEDLTRLGQGTDVFWQHVASIAEADRLVQRSHPDLAVIDIAASSLWAESMAFVEQLSKVAPAVPTIGLTNTDSLVDRVTIAQAGLQRLLMKPVTAVQVWTVAAQFMRTTRGLTAQVLVVDDDPLIIKALRSLLEPWGLGVAGLETPTQFWELLQATQPDLLILDVEMPSFSGVELCQAVRTSPEWENLPVLFLTAHRDAETVQAVFRAGADDFISKPIVGPELLSRILNRLERTRLLQTLFQRDPTTGLPNYAHSKQAFNRLLDAARVNSSQVSLTLIRVANLEAIAHQQGQDDKHAILQAWGQCFQAFQTQTAVMGYWGNGEFLMALDTPLAADLLANLLQTLRREIVHLPSGDRMQPIFETASVTFPADGQTLEALYRVAIAQVRNR